MFALRRTAAMALSALLITGGAVALAPTASAAGAPTCTHNLPDFNAVVDGAGVNYRTGPSTSYTAEGRLYTGDDLRICCEKGVWYYSKLINRSKGGLAMGTYGWIRSDMLYQLAG